MIFYNFKSTSAISILKIGFIILFHLPLIVPQETTSPDNYNTEEILKRHEIMSEDFYEVSWEIDFNTQEIAFHITAKTKGYIGFGISYTGGMANSDIVIGGVFPNGTVYFNDYHGIGTSKPLIDSSQDWILMHCHENKTHTTMDVIRKLNTCDEDDIEITDDTLKIIWTMGETDRITYHGGNRRGSMSVNFKDPASDPPNVSLYKVWQPAQPLEIPSTDTTYWCTFFKGPQLKSKHHVVGFDIFLNGSDSRRHTHHADLYKCKAPEGQDPDKYFSKYLGYGYDCYFSTDYFPVEHCELFEFQWSIGGKVTMFPDDVGVPIGEDSNEYYMTEIHYDNPGLLSGLKAHSGWDIYYTDKLRPIEAGFLQFGVKTSKYYSLTIPPNAENFVISSHCPMDCTSNLPLSGISAFVYLLHSHLSGRKQKVRHFRDGQELPWIANDEHFDFNYQNNRQLRDEVKLLPGDHITLECTYDSTWKEGKSTLGGRSAREEMCQAFFMYYPRILKVNQCGSYMSQQHMLNFFGLENVTAAKGIVDPIISSPEQYKGMKYSHFIENEVKWSPEKRAEFQNFVRYEPQQAYCVPFTADDAFMEIQYPQAENEYMKSNNCPLAYSDDNFMVIWMSILGCFVAIILLITMASIAIMFKKRNHKVKRVLPINNDVA